MSGTVLRSQVTTYYPGDVSRDKVTMTVHHQVNTTWVAGDPGYQSHANEVLALFQGADPSYSGVSLWPNRVLEVRVYDLSDAKPRPERAFATHTPTTPDPGTGSGPRQLAVVLSFFAGRNLPRYRGRIYCGPLSSGVCGNEYVINAVCQEALDLGHGLFDIGGENVAHAVWSVKDQVGRVVTDYFVANEWGTVRSRGQRATGRLTLKP